MLRRVAVVRMDISEERSASIISVTGIELGTMLAVPINGRTLKRNTSEECCVVRRPNDNSEEYITAVFRVKEPGTDVPFTC
jgi:hypothetical protein